MADVYTSTFSETAASNSAATPNGWPEGQPASSVNDCARELMAAVKRLYDRDHATSAATIGGTANAVTLTYPVAFTAYAQGQKFAFKATAGNSGAVTVNVDGLGAVALKTAAGAALAGGEIVPGQIVQIEHDGVQFQMLGTTASGVPTGTVSPFAGSAAPGGWLLCAGQAVSRTTFAALFAVIGSTYGAGDGSTTFNVPDLRGRVIAGVDNMNGSDAARLSGATGGVTARTTLGGSGGEAAHVSTTSEMPAHGHGVTDPGHSHPQNKMSADTGNPGDFGTGQFVGATTAAGFNTGTAFTGISIQSAGGGASHNNVQPTIVLNYIVKT